jgi:glycosyltransferase involved in cell wall biosynthesis
VTIAIEAPFGDNGSLAYVGASLVRAFEENGGRPIAVPSAGLDVQTASPAVFRALERHRQLRRLRRTVVDRSLRYGLHGRASVIGARSRGMLLYWDSDYIPKEVAKFLCQYDELYGVSHFVADVMRSATGRNVGVLQHGYWPEYARYSSPPGSGPFYFLHLGQVDERKATDVVMRAFVAAFPVQRSDVRMLVKCGPSQLAHAMQWHKHYGKSDDRIEINAEYVNRFDLSGWFERAHVLVMPSRCEGFGLVGLEALAHGRSVIGHGFSGPLDYLDPTDCELIPSQSSIPAALYPGQAREPDFNALVDAMQRVARDRDQTVARGVAGRARISDRWTWTERVRPWLQGS